MAEMRFDGPAERFPDAPTGAEFAEKLKANMGEWALLGRCKLPGDANQRAYMIRTGGQRGFTPAGAFEAESRTLLGEHRVYARYVGTPGV